MEAPTDGEGERRGVQQALRDALARVRRRVDSGTPPSTRCACGAPSLRSGRGPPRTGAARRTRAIRLAEQQLEPPAQGVDRDDVLGGLPGGASVGHGEATGLLRLVSVADDAEAKGSEGEVTLAEVSAGVVDLGVHRSTSARLGRGRRPAPHLRRIVRVHHVEVGAVVQPAAEGSQGELPKLLGQGRREPVAERRRRQGDAGRQLVGPPEPGNGAPSRRSRS
jgi:hypothetical protein